MMVDALIFLLFISSSITFVAGQATHMVTVGLEGSFYNPPTVAAGLSDVITFVFVGDIHTVTQGTFENPCVPLSGGFSSGFAGKGTNGSAPAPTWDLQVTNVTGPIWFFCEASKPASHCEAGMVGAINPPSQAMYQEYVSAAKAVQGTPTANLNVSLTGIGAIATNSPAVPSSDVIVTPVPSSSSSSLTPPVPTSTLGSTAPATTSTASTHFSLGVIVGASVGGASGLMLLVTIIFLCVRQKQSPTNSPPSRTASFMDPNPFHYDPSSFENSPLSNPKSPRRQRSTGNVSNLTFASPASSHSPLIPQTSQRLIPNRRTENLLDRDSFNASENTSTNNLLTVPQGGQLDVRSLAQEVATVLRSEKSSGLQRQLFVNNHIISDQNSSSNVAHSANPPNYSLATIGQNANQRFQ